jgi:DNA-binding transcriptional LysR family regulator
VFLVSKQSGFGRSLDDLQAMAVFSRVVELGSLTAAARALDTTTSSVSKRLARLEERLDVRLLERTTRSLATTEAGRVFYERSARILREVDDVELALTQLGGAPRGTLRISALNALGEVLGGLLGDFSLRYPEVRLDVELNDRQVNLIDEGYDLALRGMEIGAAADSSLIARRLAVVDPVVCAAPSYLARRGVPTRIEDLAAHDCLHYSAVALHREWSFKLPEGVRTAPVTARLQANSVAALRGAAIAGAGILRAPRLEVSEALRSGALVRLLEEYAPTEFGLYAVFSASKQALPKVRAFVDFLQEELPSRLA